MTKLDPKGIAAADRAYRKKLAEMGGPIDTMSAAIAAYLDAAGDRPSVTAPANWRLVPVEPTPKMLEAGLEKREWIRPEGHSWQYVAKEPKRAWVAMLAAAPEPPAGDGWRDILAERQRQIIAEGWTVEHDEDHKDGSLAVAGACYALNYPGVNIGSVIEGLWPWSRKWWKPTTRRRDLVKAAALILAEIERIDRLPAAPKGRDTE